MSAIPCPPLVNSGLGCCPSSRPGAIPSVIGELQELEKINRRPTLAWCCILMKVLSGGPVEHLSGPLSKGIPDPPTAAVPSAALAIMSGQPEAASVG